MKYRAKPVVVDAAQWFKNGDHPEDYTRPRYESVEEPVGSSEYFAGVTFRLKTHPPEYAKAHGWEGDVVRYFRDPGMDGTTRCPICDQPLRNHGWLDVVGGGAKVCPGDWIITGVQGERYPCKPDVFKLTYEPAEE